jgi:hypothetical protein
MEHTVGVSGARHHDPARQLNERHTDQLLDIALTMAGHPDAVSAQATSVNDTGIGILIETTDGTKVTTHVPFGAPSSGARRRLGLRDLAARAADVRNTPAEEMSS